MFACVYFGASNEFCSSPGFTQTLNAHLDVVWHFGLDAWFAIKSVGSTWGRLQVYVCRCVRGLGRRFLSLGLGIRREQRYSDMKESGRVDLKRTPVALSLPCSVIPFPHSSFFSLDWMGVCGTLSVTSSVWQDRIQYTHTHTHMPIELCRVTAPAGAYSIFLLVIRVTLFPKSNDRKIWCVLMMY